MTTEDIPSFYDPALAAPCMPGPPLPGALNTRLLKQAGWKTLCFPDRLDLDALLLIADAFEDRTSASTVHVGLYGENLRAVRTATLELAMLAFAGGFGHRLFVSDLDYAIWEPEYGGYHVLLMPPAISQAVEARLRAFWKSCWHQQLPESTMTESFRCLLAHFDL